METTPNPSLALLFGLLFVLAGPIKAMPVFQSLSAGMAVRARNMLAIKGAAFGALAICLAVIMAEAMTAKYAVSGPAVGTAAGLLLTIVGLIPLAGLEVKSEAISQPDALSLAFPILLPPHAFGLILLFSLYLPGSAMGLVKLGVALMAMNAVAMIVADAVLKKIGMVPLRLLGAIFGILQVALGVQMLFWSVPAGLGPGQ